MSNAETWRVVRAAGNIEPVVIKKNERDVWVANDVPFPASLCADDAVIDYARSMGWVIAEVRAPGELTRDEAVAEAMSACIKAAVDHDAAEKRHYDECAALGRWEHIMYFDYEAGARQAVINVLRETIGDHQ